MGLRGHRWQHRYGRRDRDIGRVAPTHCTSDAVLERTEQVQYVPSPKLCRSPHRIAASRIDLLPVPVLPSVTGITYQKRCLPCSARKGCSMPTSAGLTYGIGMSHRDRRQWEDYIEEEEVEMTGEMSKIDPVTATEPDGTEWPYHREMARVTGGSVQPFDQYQGPYVLIGADVRVGNSPYALAPKGLGVIRLWMNDDRVYREDTDTLSDMVVFEPIDAGMAALELLA